jgi:hypothetical protein
MNRPLVQKGQGATEVAKTGQSARERELGILVGTLASGSHRGKRASQGHAFRMASLKSTMAGSCRASTFLTKILAEHLRQLVPIVTPHDPVGAQEPPAASAAVSRALRRGAVHWKLAGSLSARVLTPV